VVGGWVGGGVSARAKQASKHRLQPWTSSRVAETVTSCRRADDISHNSIIGAAPRSNSCLIPLVILLSSHLLHFIWFSSANFALLLCTFACSADQFLILQTKKEEDLEDLCCCCRASFKLVLSHVLIVCGSLSLSLSLSRYQMEDVPRQREL
jgi:hypothetical protein